VRGSARVRRGGRISVVLLVRTDLHALLGYDDPTVGDAEPGGMRLGELAANDAERPRAAPRLPRAVVPGRVDAGTVRRARRHTSEVASARGPAGRARAGRR